MLFHGRALLGQMIRVGWIQLAGLVERAGRAAPLSSHAQSNDRFRSLIGRCSLLLGCSQLLPLFLFRFCTNTRPLSAPMPLYVITQILQLSHSAGFGLTVVASPRRPNILQRWPKLLSCRCFARPTWKLACLTRAGDLIPSRSGAPTSLLSFRAASRPSSSLITSSPPSTSSFGLW